MASLSQWRAKGRPSLPRLAPSTLTSLNPWGSPGIDPANPSGCAGVVPCPNDPCAESTGLADEITPPLLAIAGGAAGLYIGSSLRLRTSEIGMISASLMGTGFVLGKMVVDDDSAGWRRGAGASIGASAGVIVGAVVEEASAFGVFARKGPMLIGAGIGGLAGLFLLPPILEPGQALFGAAYGLISTIADFIESSGCSFIGDIGEIPGEYKDGSLVGARVSCPTTGGTVQRWDDFLDGVIKYWPGRGQYTYSNPRERLAGILLTRCDGANKLFGDVGGDWILHAGHIPTFGNNEYMVTAGGVTPGWKVAAKYACTTPQAFVQSKFFKSFVKPFECDLFSDCPPGEERDPQTGECVSESQACAPVPCPPGMVRNTKTCKCVPPHLLCPPGSKNC